MQTVRQDVQLRLAPGHELAIEPDAAVAIVEGKKRHVRTPSLRKNISEIGRSWTNIGSPGCQRKAALVT